jgi:hypothetical protein
MFSHGFSLSFFPIDLEIFFLSLFEEIILKVGKKTPQLGIEPRFSDLKSDVLTVERLRFVQS